MTFGGAGGQPVPPPEKRMRTQPVPARGAARARRLGRGVCSLKSSRGSECTVGTWVGATVGRGGGVLLSTEGVYSRDMGRGNSREGGGGCIRAESRQGALGTTREGRAVVFGR